MAPGQATAIAATLAVSAAAVNLAYFAPRLAYVDETSLGMGYGPLRALGRMLAGFDPQPYQPGFGAGWGWPLKLSAPPGAYLGGAMLIAVFLAFSSRYRRLAWTFAAVTAFVYVTSLTAFISVLPHAVDDLLPVDLYLHAPWWLGYEIVLSLSVLGAIGLTAWARCRSAHPPHRGGGGGRGVDRPAGGDGGQLAGAGSGDAGHRHRARGARARPPPARADVGGAVCAGGRAGARRHLAGARLSAADRCRPGAATPDSRLRAEPPMSPR